MNSKKCKKYHLYSNCIDFTRYYYAQLQNGLWYIYYNYEDYDEGKGFIWLEQGYKKIKLLLSYNFYDDCNSHKAYCYLLLKEVNDEWSIIELTEKKIILSGIKNKSIKCIKKRTLKWDEHEVKEDDKDAVIVICNEIKKMYSLFSLKKGYIFGPYTYNKIDFWAWGAVLDNHIEVNNNGYVFDFSDYETKDGEIYYNKVKDDYKIFIDEFFIDDETVGGLFSLHHEKEAPTSFVIWDGDDEADEDDENILMLKLNDVIYVYNKKTGILTKNDIPVYHEYEWTERDTWDALTDGQYGDYPEEGVDLDSLYDSMGI